MADGYLNLVSYSYIWLKIRRSPLLSCTVKWLVYDLSMGARLKWPPWLIYYNHVSKNVHLLHIEDYMKVGWTLCRIRESHKENGSRMGEVVMILCVGLRRVRLSVRWAEVLEDVCKGRRGLGCPTLEWCVN